MVRTGCAATSASSRLAAEGQGDQQAMYAIDTVLRDEYLNLALRHAARAFVEPARGEGHAHCLAHRDGQIWVVQLVRRFWAEFRY